MPWTFEATERGYTNLWRSAKLKGGADAANADLFSNKIIAAETQYRSVQNATGVPWYFIGALHMRESSCNFAGVLHNGEHIIGTGRLTTLEPPGRGPFSTWAEAAIDALKLKNMHRVQAWSAARMLYQAEVFNGTGYTTRGVNSPYVWAGTSHEQRGKYVADHQFDPNAEDTQLGVAAVLIRLAEKRSDIAADLYPSTVEPSPMPDEPSDLLKEIQGLRAEIAALPAALVAALKGTAPAPAPKPDPAPATAPTPASAASTPIYQQPGVQLGVLGGLATLLLQAFGYVGPPTGDTATNVGTLLPILAGGAVAGSVTGTWGTILNAVTTVISLLSKGTAAK